MARVPVPVGFHEWRLAEERREWCHSKVLYWQRLRPQGSEAIFEVDRCVNCWVMARSRWSHVQSIWER
eukprot:8645544-Alexandrium_andersonii.AAC.1